MKTIRQQNIYFLFGWILILLVFNAAPALAQPGPQNTWALCIGISEYDPPDINLKWANKDAIEFSSFHKHGLGLPSDV